MRVGRGRCARSSPMARPIVACLLCSSLAWLHAWLVNGPAREREKACRANQAEAAEDIAFTLGEARRRVEWCRWVIDQEMGRCERMAHR